MKKLIKNFKKYRFLLYELVKKDITLKYRRSYLGIVWTLLEPLLTMIVLTIVFSSFYGRSDRLFPVYVLTGRLLFTFFQNSTRSAMKSIRSNSAMIKKVYVPKYIYPLSSIISNFITFLISLIVLVAVAAVLRLKPSIYMLNSVIPLAILFIMAFGVSMILATLAVFFRDLEYLWGVALMLIMYSSAIFYDPERLVKNGVGWILEFNPIYAVIRNFRNCIYGSPLDSKSLTFAACFSIVSLLVGMLLFYKKQDDFILHI